MKTQSITDILKTKRLYFDGGTGTVLQERGLKPGVPPEILNLENPEMIETLHSEYLSSGADIIKTNTFGVNSLKYENYAEYIKAALAIANRAKGESDKFIALDIGPTGKMLKPLGDLDFEDAVEVFSKNIRAAEGLGADLILIETMTDIYEAKAAVVAAKESSNLPIFVTVVFDESGKLLTGADVDTVVTTLEGLGVSALGVNCSLGPDKLLPIVKKMCEMSSTPVIVNPNAGLPTEIDGETKFNVCADDFACHMQKIASFGACVLGGCCGTTPEYITKTIEKTEKIPYVYPTKKNAARISSYTHALTIGEGTLIVGERINPTGKPRLKEALRLSDMNYLLSEAIAEEDDGAHALDVNVGLPDIDETDVMRRAVCEIQAVTSLPLQIDSSNPDTLAAAMRIYNGKPLVNSVNGKESSMRAVFPLVKKYGGVVIALTMDEDGIPATADGRVKIAEKILSVAGEYGLGVFDIVFDPLAMAISSDKEAANVTLSALKELKARGYLTSLGVSNVSFGLPSRDLINAAYFTLAMSIGLDLAIINPHSKAMLDAYRAYTAISGRDEDFLQYISYARANEGKGESAVQQTEISLKKAVISGLRDKAREIAASELSLREPLELVNFEIIPALTEVGERFESGRAYLPELLMSAEAANAAFDEVKKKMPPKNDATKEKIVLATVKGDIHDIGKNIVKTLLESYGFSVIDLGRDVPCEAVLEATLESGASLVGLSSLMTTTVGAMEETIALLKSKTDVKVMVGGAVLTPEYAEKIHADYYASDAMDGVKIAQEVFKAK